MFAHQVIEDMEAQNRLLQSGVSLTYRDKHVDIHNYIEYQKRIIEMIRQSQKFHITDENAMIQFRKEAINKEPCFVNHIEYIKLPYDYVYLDYVVDDSKADEELQVCKIAALISKAENNDYDFRITFLAQRIKDHKWWLSPQGYVVHLGAGLQVFTILDISQKDREKIISEDRGDITIINNFLLLLNCRNIYTENTKPPAALNKARRKRGKQELFTYKTLKLLLPGKKEKHSLISEPTGEHNRIHYCRGHFKEYTAEAPLFGKITGLWWWQPSVRGKNKEGVVIKDYNIAINTQEGSCQQ
jgi:hypothetical protein